MNERAITVPKALENNPFDKLAGRYDAWFDGPGGRRVFAAESHLLRDLLEEMPRRWLEVGVGTGRFAQALGADDGIDPSLEVLKIAAQRNVKIWLGYAENLLYSVATFYTSADVTRMATGAGFGHERSRSCLFEPPESEMNDYSGSREGIMPGAGFVGMRFRKEH